MHRIARQKLVNGMRVEATACQSWRVFLRHSVQSQRDPGIIDSSIPDPGIEKRDPGLQCLG